MDTNYNLIQIDFLTLFDHSNLDLNDDCFYFMEYPRGGIEYNRGNAVVSFIMNFKKSVTREGFSDWKYKKYAIDEVSKRILSNIPYIFGPWDSFTLIPIPPSKKRDHPEYDDRLVKALLNVKGVEEACQVIDLFQNINNLVPSHIAAVRPSKDEIKSNLSIDNTKIHLLRPTILLFDDVLTNGTHFKACKELLLAINPHFRVIGIFIARTVS